MKAATLTMRWDRLNQLRKRRQIRNLGTLGLVLLGPVLAIMTFTVIGVLDLGATSTSLRSVLLVDLVYVLVVVALVMQRVARMIAARRAQSAGSRLHLRLTGVFTIIALMPTVLVAVFATATLNLGLEGWFSDRVRQVVGNSLLAAQAYEQEHRDDLQRDALILADFLNQTKRVSPILNNGDLRELLTQGQTQVQRNLREAFVIDGTAILQARGEKSYLFDFEAPTREQLASAVLGEIVIIEDWANNEFRALISLDAFLDRFLYVSRDVDGNILSLLDETRETVTLYQQLESERGKLLFEFGLIYLGFALIVILAAIWFGLWFAERLAGPVGNLAGAVQRVGAGDLDVRVKEGDGDDEIAMLGRVFNQMTKQLKGQRGALIDAHELTDTRRRLFDSVLSGVTAGVISLNAGAEVDFLNASAIRMLGFDHDLGGGTKIVDVIPEFEQLFDKLAKGQNRVVQEEIRLTRAGIGENLLVRIAKRNNADGALEGYVITFDDVTDLVSAQRMAAWGDVARRIAHEIKNPLTPIQLSAESLKRKFSKVPGIDQETLEKYTDVIVRQTNDLRRIVDEFSKFARMPEPERKTHDLVKLLKDAVVLQQTAMPDVSLKLECEQDEIWGEFDATMISQALINLIKNAGEAIESLQAKGAPESYAPEIRVDVDQNEAATIIRIMDNGIGLPEQRARLFEPYVTNRAKGTGLGLSIVKKIIDEHDGNLELLDAPIFENNEHFGAEARVELPIPQPQNLNNNYEQTE